MNDRSVFQLYENSIASKVEKIKTVTRQLHEKFGTIGFNSIRISNNGEYRILTDMQRWSEFYYGKQLYLLDPFWRHPSNFQSGTMVFNPDARYQAERSKCSVGGAFTFVNRTTEGVEFSAFMLSDKSQNTPELFLNEIKILRSFETYFREQTVLLANEQEPIPVPSIIDNFFRVDPYSSSSLSIKDRVEWIEALYPSLPIRAYLTLTKSEKYILPILFEGLTMVGMGVRLGLSTRTVEHRLDACRTKLGCDSLSELRVVCHKFHKLGVIE